VVPVGVAATAVPGGGLRLDADRVPWARWASHLLVLHAAEGGSRLSLVEAAAASITPGSNLAGEPRDRVVLGGAHPVVAADVGRPLAACLAQLRLAGALARSVQMAGATESVVRLSAQYCADRRQFGRPLREFQAVQQELAALVGESRAASAAVTAALLHVRASSNEWPLAPVATAKVRAGLAAGAAARSAHQVHGAMGITLEYPLHRYTRALWSWREEFGGEEEWARALHRDLAAGGTADPWTRLAPV